MNSQAPKPDLKLEWQRSPWTIKALAYLAVIAYVGSIIITGFQTLMIGSIAIGALLIFGLVRGSRTAWVVSLIFDMLAAVTLVNVFLARVMAQNKAASLFFDVPVVFLNVFFLLHPLTRGWLRPQGQTSADRLRELAHRDK